MRVLIYLPTLSGYRDRALTLFRAAEGIERLAAPLFRRGVPVEVLTSLLRGTAPKETIARVPVHRVSAFGFDRIAERPLALYRALVSGTGRPSCAS